VKADQEERRKKKEEELSSRMGLRPQKTMAIFWEKIHGAWGPLKPRFLLRFFLFREIHDLLRDPMP
jgi:hypothetical protein